MRAITALLSTKTHSLVAFFILLVFAACGSYHDPLDTKHDPLDTKKEEHVPGKAIVLFHGLGSTPQDFEQMLPMLKSQFPDAEVIAIDRPNSQTQGISQQAGAIFQELKNRGIDKKQVVLIGYSQGGLVAYETYNAHKNVLDVKGIIGITTPWEGAPIAAAEQQDIAQFSQKVSENLLISMAASLMKINISQAIQQLFKTLINGMGVADLKPSSSFLQSVQTSLPGAQVPILAIVGSQGSFIALLSSTFGIDLSTIASNFNIDLSSQPGVFSDIDTSLATLLGDPNHDTGLPVYSQQAKNLTKSAKFETIEIAGIHHDTALNEQVVIDKVISTAKRYFQD